MTIASSSMNDGKHSGLWDFRSRGPLKREPLSRQSVPAIDEGDSLSAYVDAGEEAWRVFMEAGLSSSFYYTAREHLEPFDAAAITLLKSYLDTFFPRDRALVEGDPDCFYRYASAFLREISMPELAHAPELPARRLLMARARKLCKQWKPAGSTASVDRRAFIAAMLRMCASLECIIHARDVYKEYMFRIYPQLRVRVA